MTEPWSLTIAEALTALERGALSAVELTRALLQRIAAIDPGIRAYLAVDDAGALAQADAADARRQRGEHRHSRPRQQRREMLRKVHQNHRHQEVNLSPLFEG